MIFIFAFMYLFLQMNQTTDAFTTSDANRLVAETIHQAELANECEARAEGLAKGLSVAQLVEVSDIAAVESEVYTDVRRFEDKYALYDYMTLPGCRILVTDHSDVMQMDLNRIRVGGYAPEQMSVVWKP